MKSNMSNVKGMFENVIEVSLLSLYKNWKKM